VSSEPDEPPAPRFRGFVLGGALLIAALGGAFLARNLSPSRQQLQHSGEAPARPIVQIVRQQPGLPDVADLVDRLCPSVATIVTRGADVPTDISVPATAFSAEGWLVTYGTDLPQGPLDAVFGDGRRLELSDLRTDPVSSLAIVKANEAPNAPLALSDQAFPRVGQFGLVLTTSAGTGCSAEAAMIGSDFLADGGGPNGYVRLRPPPADLSAGSPVIGTDGRLLGIGVGDPSGALIPAAIASVILDELVRNSLSPATSFGFRAIDYSPPMSTRLGDVRAGAGVALVQAKSAAARAGLHAGDVVTAVNGAPVSSASELSRSLDSISGKATLTVERQSQKLDLTIKRATEG
jgi:S1-C subfamily serine protease